jgi:hypothetical protein
MTPDEVDDKPVPRLRDVETRRRSDGRGRGNQRSGERREEDGAASCGHGLGIGRRAAAPIPRTDDG